MNPMLKAPGTTCFNLEYDTLLSSFAFNVNLRRYIKVLATAFFAVLMLKTPISVGGGEGINGVFRWY